ncbi:MAG TPA: hypothetical protein EYP59_01955 [Thiotrichaceae bacterium]|nr:hypothetical protein [Thiotrichaceae bacterium]
MSDYNFSSLNDKEFESLSTDILSCHFGQHVERFKAGQDKDVDGRFYSSPNIEVIIQCKHWLKSGIATLLRNLENKEAEKVRKINPKRYVFVTSLELSNDNKKKIKNIFSPYILREDDIFCNEDINDLLSRHPQIEQKHYKLWITSTNVLNIILNAAIVGRSRYKLKEIVEESNRYVVTQSHHQAMKKLEKIRSIIITGSPGVGKTSLADQLCQYYVASNYELCFIENSLNEAEEHYNEKQKQIFYFDDFLGRNFLLALNPHQDSHVINFIKRVERDSKKRFILTSRSNILNQGKRLSDLFEIKKIDKNEYEVSIASLSEYDKAKILYNHIWFSQLEDGYIDEIYKEKRYHKIIKHQNFNPRLIAFITDSHRLRSVNSKNYWNYIERTLENPQGIWKNVFDVQIDEISRHVVIAVSIHGEEISESNLKEFYRRLKSSRLNLGNDMTFDTTMRFLVGALLDRNIISQNNVIYDLFNPSIADYVISDYMDDIDYLDELLSCLKTSQAVGNIHSLFKYGKLKQDFCAKLVEKQLNRIARSETQYELDNFLLRLLILASKVISPKNNLLDYIARLSEYVLNNGCLVLNRLFFDLINWVMDLGIINEKDSRLEPLLESWILDEERDYDEYISLSKIIVRVEPIGGELTDEFKQLFIEDFSEDITRKIIESDILSDVYDDDLYSYEIKDFVNENVSEIAIKFESSEIEKISESCDVNEIIQSNINAEMNDEQHKTAQDDGYSALSSINAIDDLFDRGEN